MPIFFLSSLSRDFFLAARHPMAAQYAIMCRFARRLFPDFSRCEALMPSPADSNRLLLLHICNALLSAYTTCELGGMRAINVIWKIYIAIVFVCVCVLLSFLLTFQPFRLHIHIWHDGFSASFFVPFCWIVVVQNVCAGSSMVYIFAFIYFDSASSFILLVDSGVGDNENGTYSWCFAIRTQAWMWCWDIVLLLISGSKGCWWWKLTRSRWMWRAACISLINWHVCDDGKNLLTTWTCTL